MSMSTTAYEKLRETSPHLPTPRYLKETIYRNGHQASGVLRSSIRENVKHVIAKMTLDDQKAASLGNIAFDAMSIRKGLAWNNSTGKFSGMSESTTNRSPQQLFLDRVHRLTAPGDMDTDPVAENKRPIRLAIHHLVFYYTSVKGIKVSFICARLDLDVVHKTLLFALLSSLVRELFYFGPPPVADRSRRVRFAPPIMAS